MRSDALRVLAALLLALAMGGRAEAQSDAGAPVETDPLPTEVSPAEPEPDPPSTATPPSTQPPSETTPGPTRIESAPSFSTTAPTPAPTTTTTVTTTPRSTTAPRTDAPRTPAPRAATTRTTVTAPEAEPPPAGDGRDVDFLWIEVEGGVSNVNLLAFRNANFAAGDTDVLREVTGTGPMVGAAVGFRVYWLAIGARMTYAAYEAFQIGTVGGDVQLRLPIPIVEPYIRVGFGYAWQGDANYSDPAMSATRVYGWSFDAAVGFDIFVTNWLSIGGGIGFDLLNMTRQRDPLMMPVTTFHPEQDGDAIGYQLRGFAQIGLHF